MFSSHRSGGLKQSNKRHKSSKASKRLLNRNQGAGRVEKNGGKGGGRGGKTSGNLDASASRKNRQNEALQRRRNNRAAKMSMRRIGMMSSVAGARSDCGDPPKVVGVICLSEGRLGSEGLLGRCEETAIKRHVESLPCSDVSPSDPSVVAFPQLKGRVQILTPRDLGAREGSSPSDSDYIPAALELARVADVLLFVFDGVSALSDPIHQSTAGTTSGALEYPNLISVLGERTLTCIKAQGLPQVASLLLLPPRALSTEGVSKKNGGMTKGEKRKLDDLRKYTARFLKSEVGYDVKVVEEDNVDVTASASSPGDADTVDMVDAAGSASTPPALAAATSAATTAPPLVRTLVSTPPSPIHFVGLSARNYLVSSKFDYDPSTSTLNIEGFVRGQGAFSVNNLVHVGGVGTFQLSSITEIAASSRKNPAPPASPLLPNPDLQEPLEMFAAPDALEGEQNLVGFDGDEDAAEFDAMMDENETDAASQPVARPAGWSDYQSAWLEDADRDDLEDVCGEDDHLDHGELSDMFNKKPDDDGNDNGGNSSDADMDDVGGISEAERLELEKRRKSAKEDLDFPDEVQVVEDEEARTRFARYRSLKSFRKSTWDPKESLPEDYGTLYHFSNFKATARGVIADQKEVASELVKRSSSEDGSDNHRAAGNDETIMADSDTEEDHVAETLKYCAAPNKRVAVGISNFTAANFEALGKSNKSVITITTLLPHENKMSVLHFNICQTLKCETMNDLGKESPVKSKDVLTFQVGWRTWQSRPTFSQNNLNSDKNKFERFLFPGAFMACSCYGPVTYGPCPVLIWREPQPGQSQRQLVAVGSVLGADADRIVIKRAILTGYPVRVHKRNATVKYMFYNPEDVKWFKPAGLTTKHGLQGGIVESLGTHGAMKCLFNQPIKQHDTVCLTLWKRIFPKFAGKEQERGEFRVV